MVSKIQWKPFCLATQLFPQNDWTGWQICVMTYAHRPHYITALGGGGDSNLPEWLTPRMAAFAMCLQEKAAKLQQTATIEVLPIFVEAKGRRTIVPHALCFCFSLFFPSHCLQSGTCLSLLILIWSYFLLCFFYSWSNISLAIYLLVSLTVSRFSSFITYCKRRNFRMEFNFVAFVK